MGRFQMEKRAPGVEEIQDPWFETEVWVGIIRELLCFKRFCPTRLSALRGISASFGLTFGMGDAGMLGEAGSQLCLTSVQLPVSYAVSRQARCLLLSIGSSVFTPPEFSLACKHLYRLCFQVVPALMLEEKIPK